MHGKHSSKRTRASSVSGSISQRCAGSCFTASPTAAAPRAGAASSPTRCLGAHPAQIAGEGVEQRARLLQHGCPTAAEQRGCRRRWLSRPCQQLLAPSSAGKRFGTCSCSPSLQQGSLAKEISGTNRGESAAYKQSGFGDAVRENTNPSLGTVCCCCPQPMCVGSAEMCWILRNCQILKLSTRVGGIMKTQL